MLKILFILLLFFFISYSINLKIKRFFEEKKLFIYSKKQYYIDNIILNLFILFFIFFFRIVRIFLVNVDHFDLKKVFVFSNYDFVIITKLLFLIVFLFFLRKIIFFTVKISFLRLHYYFFMRFILYQNIFYFLSKFHLFFFRFTGNNKYIYLYISLFFKSFHILIFFFFFIQSVIFNNFIMYTGFIQVYLLYNFFLKLYLYLGNFESSFDEGIIKNYYPDFFGLTDLAYLKLNLYFQKLIFEKSTYKFCNPILFEFNKNYPNNWIFFEKDNFRYTSIFNNILHINKKIKPKFRI